MDGDIMCLRSGAWSAEDYFADMKRKLKRPRAGIVLPSTL